MPHHWKHSRPGWTGLWATWSSWRCPCSLQEGWTRRTLKFPSNPNHYMILWFTFLTSNSVASWPILGSHAISVPIMQPFFYLMARSTLPGLIQFRSCLFWTLFHASKVQSFPASLYSEGLRSSSSLQKPFSLKGMMTSLFVFSFIKLQWAIYI